MHKSVLLFLCQSWILRQEERVELASSLALNYTTLKIISTPANNLFFGDLSKSLPAISHQAGF